MAFNISEIDCVPHKRVEIKESRLRFPIGINVGECLYRHFSLRPLTGRHEIVFGKIEIDHFRDDDPKTLYTYSNKILKRIFLDLVEEVGDYDLDTFLRLHSLNINQLIEKLYLADVLFLFVSVRIASYGQNIKIGGPCPCPRKEKINPTDDQAHDLETVEMTLWDHSEPPIFRYHFHNPPSDDRTYVDLSPPLFFQLPALLDSPDNDGESFFLRLLQTLTPDPDIIDLYLSLSRHDRNRLRKFLPLVNIFGPDKSIAMDCPICGLQWDSPLLNGYNYEMFYLTMLNIPRVRKIYAGENPAEILLNKVAFFLTTGEQAPMASPESVYDMTVSSRNYWVEELSKTYEKQAEEMKKSQAKSKSRKR